ncbi:MAG: hypothetical protein DRP87_01660 [Spirochaetes bacterium]|nr:MAG: hypothetical protein DRP87_01660 [Spirochaetota bacterium]
MSAYNRRFVLVTGASGFIGRHLARVLMERGYSVRAVYRRENPPLMLKELETKGAELLRLDLSVGENLLRAVSGVDRVIHAAAIASDWGKYEIFHKYNYEMAISLLEASKESGCSVFVYLSSVSVHGFGNHVESTEEGPYYPPVSFYQETKKKAEDYVLAQNQTGYDKEGNKLSGRALKTTVIRPGNVYGPEDGTTFFPIFEAMERGIMGYIGKGHTLTCPVYVEDLAEAVILAMEKEESAGKCFNITGGERVTWRELLKYCSSLLGCKPPVLSIPVPAAFFLAHLMEFIFKMIGIKSAPPLTLYRVAQLSHNYHFNISRAEKLLGFKPKIPWKEGFKRTVLDYLENYKPVEKSL